MVGGLSPPRIAKQNGYARKNVISPNLGTGEMVLEENTSMRMVVCVVVLAVGSFLKGQGIADDPQARPPVTKADLEIVKHAREILDSPSKWNRADNRDWRGNSTPRRL